MTKNERRSINVLAVCALLMAILVTIPIVNQAQEGIKQELTGREIAAKVYQRPDGDDRKSVWQMTLIDKRGRKRVRKAAFYSKDHGEDTKSLIYFLEPADIEGTGFLSYEYDSPQKEDDRWLYLPALKKVRRVSGTSKNDYFMGTDFTYEDMGKRPVDDDTHTLLREEDAAGHRCWVIESVPRDEDDPYSKRVSWVRQDSLCEARIDYYDRRGSLIKILTVPHQKKQDGFWTAFKMVMDNVQKRHKTILEIKEMSYNLGLKESLFRVSSLERGRIYD